MRHKLAGLLEDAPILMGIVNVTPDSFSDGGQFFDTDRAVAHGLKLLEDGAQILDIGGESTRPGAEAVSIEEELRRVIPVIEGLKGKAAHISIDTRNASVMAGAIAAGATIVNDVSALAHDPDSMGVVADSGVPVCLMHMKGTPETMQDAPEYGDVLSEVLAYFEARIAACVRAGIAEDQIILDPGIGFGKTVEHNLLLLKNLSALKCFGLPVLLGVSRKRFIAAVSKGEPEDARLPGSLAAALWGLEQGAEIFRVHDVAETRQAFSVYDGIQSVRQ